MKQRLREANLGKVIPLYVREKISNTLKGRPGIPHSEETKKKLSEIASNRIGELAPNYGKKFSDDHKQKLSAAKRVNMLEY